MYTEADKRNMRMWAPGGKAYIPCEVGWFKSLLTGCYAQVFHQRLVSHPVECCCTMLCRLLACMVRDLVSGWNHKHITLSPSNFSVRRITVPVTPAIAPKTYQAVQPTVQSLIATLCTTHRFVAC